MFKKLTKIFLVLVLLFPIFLFSAVMQSGNYKIQKDSLNFGGGLGTSSNFREEDTLGEIGSGTSSSATYNLNAGYQALDSNYISISHSGNITLPNGAISGISGGTAQGTSTWTVVTDDPAGYQLTIVSLTAPSLKSASSSFADYITAGSNPDFTFSFGVASSTFGFTVEGVDIIGRYKDNGSACNTGSGDQQGACWDGVSTTPKIIAASVAANHPNGATTTVRYQAGVGSDKIQDSGTYTSTVTVTATAL